MIVLSDVNLSDISFNKLGKGVELKFIDMHKGDFLSHIQCNAVYLFNYHNTFLEDEGFACYIAAVECTFIPSSLVPKILSEKNFGFMDVDGSIYKPSSKDLINLRLDSGDIVIDLVCEEVIKDGIKLKL